MQKEGLRDVADFLGKLQKKNDIVQLKIKETAGKKDHRSPAAKKQFAKFGSKTERKIPSERQAEMFVDGCASMSTT